VFFKPMKASSITPADSATRLQSGSEAAVKIGATGAVETDLVLNAAGGKRPLTISTVPDRPAHATKLQRNRYMKRTARTVVLGVACALVAAPALSAQKPLWPDLPKKFVNGRAATAQDVKAGRAIFMLMPEDQSGQAASVKVPQYALWRDPRGRQRRGVVVQAEKNKDGSEVVALRVGGEVDIIPLEEVKLLGLKKPRP
jgi:hypothetical protein